MRDRRCDRVSIIEIHGVNAKENARERKRDKRERKKDEKEGDVCATYITGYHVDQIAC